MTTSITDLAILTVRNTLSTKFPTLYAFLQDACEAFEMQNKFLNNEILELNQLRQDDLLRENNLIEWVFKEVKWFVFNWYILDWLIAWLLLMVDWLTNWLIHIDLIRNLDFVIKFFV